LRVSLFFTIRMKVNQTQKRIKMYWALAKKNPSKI